MPTRRAILELLAPKPCQRISTYLWYNKNKNINITITININITITININININIQIIIDININFNVPTAPCAVGARRRDFFKPRSGAATLSCRRVNSEWEIYGKPQLLSANLAGNTWTPCPETGRHGYLLYNKNMNINVTFTINIKIATTIYINVNINIQINNKIQI